MNTDKVLQEQIKNAPIEIKSLLESNEWLQVVDQITQKNNFSAEQKTALENEVLFVLLSMELATDLSNNLQSTLLIPETLAQQITSEIQEKIFKEIGQLLPRKVETDSEGQGFPVTKEVTVPEIPLEDLPAVVQGEKAHEEENKPTINNQIKRPDIYPLGQDPYREPIE